MPGRLRSLCSLAECPVGRTRINPLAGPVEASGSLVSSLRYTAFGEVRAASGTTSTDYRYTGQRSETEIGLYYFVARFYDLALGRFIQADTVVPDPYNPQDWDRYSYVRNNPINYKDPSGHMVACDKDDWACQTHWDYPVITPNDDKDTFDTRQKNEQVETLYNVAEIVLPIFYRAC